MRFLLSLCLLTVLSTGAQVIPDSIALQKGKDQARYLYERAIEGTHHLYNGSEYLAYQPFDEEHPYFLEGEWTLGQLKYDGEWFYGVPLLFDLQKELLIASYYYKGFKMQLIHDRIDEFTISGHRFVNRKNLADSTQSGRGFYELMYEGKAQVLTRRVKKLSQRIDGLEEFREFLETSQLYLSTKGHFFKINSKRDVFNALSSHKKELRTFIRKNKLFINNRELSTVQVARYYDSLNP